MSLKGLEQDFRGEISQKYLQKILQALRSRHLIAYHDHRGCRGTFLLLVINFRLINGKITASANSSNSQADNYSGNTSGASPAQPFLNSSGVKRKWKSQKFGTTELKNHTPDSTIFASPNNKNNNKNNTIDIDSNYPHHVNNFIAGNHAEEKCREIAIALGEKNMCFILAMLKEYGLMAIETAYRDTIDNRQVINRRRYFNAILTRNYRQQESN